MKKLFLVIQLSLLCVATFAQTATVGISTGVLSASTDLGISIDPVASASLNMYLNDAAVKPIAKVSAGVGRLKTSDKWSAINYTLSFVQVGAGIEVFKKVPTILSAHAGTIIATDSENEQGSTYAGGEVEFSFFPDFKPFDLFALANFNFTFSDLEFVDRGRHDKHTGSGFGCVQIGVRVPL